MTSVCRRDSSHSSRQSAAHSIEFSGNYVGQIRPIRGEEHRSRPARWRQGLFFFGNGGASAAMLFISPPKMVVRLRRERPGRRPLARPTRNPSRYDCRGQRSDGFESIFPARLNSRRQSRHNRGAHHPAAISPNIHRGGGTVGVVAAARVY